MSTVKTDQSPGAGPYHGTGTIGEYMGTLREPAWMVGLRRSALARFQALDWPTTRDEEWRRSDISNYKFDEYAYGRTIEEQQPEPKREVPDGYSGVIRFDGSRCVGIALKAELESRGVRFVSLGSFLAAASPTAGTTGESTATAGGSSPSAGTEAKDAAFLRSLEDLFRRSIDAIDNRIQAWHYAVWNRGVGLYVPEFVEITEPFRISFNESGDGELASPEVAIILEKGARASVVQVIEGSEDDEIIYNEGSDLLVRDGASLQYFAVQDLNIDSSIFTNGSSWVLRDGSVRHFTAVFGGMFAKQRFDCVLDGPGSDVRLDGMYFPHEDQHFDVRTVQHHNAPHAVSRTYYKGAIKDEAHAVYQGLIQVSENAVRTDAFLEDKNLLLSEGARADSIPSLQINTDDVKCSHGSTTGKVDRRQVFYLMSRGYSREEAEELLVEGYFEDLIAETPEPLHQTLRGKIAARILESGDEDDDEE